MRRSRRLVGAASIAFLVLVVAVTPLNAIFRPGNFDARYVDELGRVSLATLQDQTGLVSAMVFASTDPPTTSGSTTRLVVDWIGGCLYPTVYMRFSAIGNRYELSERTDGSMCMLDFGLTRRFVLQLRVPIDAASVDIVHE